MAIVVRGLTKCPLCAEVIAAEQPIVSTSHFIESPAHPLWQFSDAAMHYDCFQTWAMRDEFVAEYNNSFGRMVWGDGSRHHMQSDGIVISETIKQ
jgi:hypothetical protein